MRRILGAVLGVGVALSVVQVQAATPPSRAQATRTPARSVTAPLDDPIDVRTHNLVLASHLSERAAHELRTTIPDLRVTWNGRTGTASQIFSDAGYLSPPSAADPVTIARRWIASHANLFGLDAGTTLSVARSATLPHSGLHPLTFRVVYGDIQTFAGGTIHVNVARDGRIVSVSADNGPTGVLSNAPRLTATDAFHVVARSERSVIQPSLRVQRPGGDRLAIFELAGGVQRHNARLVAFPTATGPLLAWRVFLAAAPETMIVSLVDAANGRVLWRQNRTLHEAAGSVYQNYPGSPKGGTQELVSFGPTPQSPDGWVAFKQNAAAPAVPSFTTAGNNAVAFADWAFPDLAGAGLAPVPALAGAQFQGYPESMPFSPTQQFTTAHDTAWEQDCTPLAAPSQDTAAGPVGGDQVTENPNYIKDRDAATTNVFYLFNRIHDLSYGLGFDEAMGNFQQFNYGKGGKELDNVRVISQASILSSSLNNAFFSTSPDGGEPADIVMRGIASQGSSVVAYSPSFSAIFMTRPETGWNAICGDLDYDASSVWHEYTHGITTRTVGDPNTADGLNGQQSGAMGEGWSDWFATHFLHTLGVEKRNVVGGWTEANLATGYRNFALDKSPLTYGDFGYSLRGPEVHADGEIWAATLWDLRTALVKRYGASKGADRAGNIVYHALTLSAGSPTFLTMRNDILSADKALYGSADRDLLWSVFARRGMGVSAKAKDDSDTHPVPAFDLPKGNTLWKGQITDLDGGTLQARIMIGAGQATSNAAAVSRPDGSFALPLAPGIPYHVTVSAPGYGSQVIGDFDAAHVPSSIRLSKNLAAYGYGASIVGEVSAGDPGTTLIDDNESTRDTVSEGKSVVVKLAGSGPATVRGIAVVPRGSGTRQARSFTVETSIDGKHWSASGLKGGVRAGRPFTTITAMRRVGATLRKPVTARYVRVSGLTSDAGDTQLAEIEVYGSAPGVIPRSIKASGFSGAGSVRQANPAGDSSSVTMTSWQASCTTPTAPVQGFDSYIMELPDEAGNGLFNLAEKNRGGVGTDIDVYFYAADCTSPTGAIATGAASEAGQIPVGSKWVQFVLYAGTTDGFDVTGTSLLTPVKPPRR